MSILDYPVPYADRCIRTQSGMAVVWPFLNAGKGDGPYELFLDTNALKNLEWFSHLPVNIQERSVINPWPAMLEQWMSNSKFRDAPEDRISEMTGHLEKNGILFRDQFAKQQASLLRKNDAALRSQFSLLFPYVALMKSLLTEKVPAEEVLQRLELIVRSDIPRFASALMLLALGALLKNSQSQKLADDSKPAFSYLESFLAFQPGQKDETDYINIPYLRNRAGDLNLWLSLPILRQHGYRFVGTPALVTGDRALHRLILRVLPPLLTDSKKMAITLQSEGLPNHICDRICGFATTIKPRTFVTVENQLARMSNLFALAKKGCAKEKERLALDQVFVEWWRPGLGKPLDLSCD